MPVIVFDYYLILGLWTLIGLLLGLWYFGGHPKQKGSPAPTWANPPDPLSAGTLLVVGLGGGLITGLMINLLLSPLVGLVLGLGTGIILPLWFQAYHRNRWVVVVDQAVLNLLSQLILKLKGGQNLLAALESISPTIQGPLQADLQHFIVGPIAGGDVMPLVFSRLRDSRRYEKTWRFRRLLRNLTTATRAEQGAVDTSNQLKKLQAALIDSYALQQEMETELAQAKYTRWIMASLLPITVGAMSWMVPEIAIKLTDTLTGQLVLVGAVFMVVLSNYVGALIAQMKPLEL